MSNFVYCPECKEIIEAQEPCACVFDVVGTIDVHGVLHTTKRVDLEPLAQTLADFNAETRRWIAEDPTQRWGGLLVEDLAHWVRYGITTPAELAEYLDQCAAKWEPKPCADPEWTEEALSAAVAHMDEVEERAWLDTTREEYGDRGERAVLETDSVATIANVHFEGEGYITVYADMSNGRALTLFRYYEDELCFSSQELVGKTKAQALALFHKKDVAYLRS